MSTQNIKKLFDLVVYKSNNFHVGQDWEIPIPGFFILGANRKIRSIADFSPEESAEFFPLLQKIRAGMRDVLGVQDVYIIHNEDTPFNFHFWLFPRFPWMDEHGKYVESVRPLMKFAREHHNTDEVKKQVHEFAEKMKMYLSN